MYDATSEPREFIADSREEAVGKACAFFGLSEGDLTLRDLDATISGLSARAGVVARPAGSAAGPGEGSSERPRGRRGGRRERGERGGTRQGSEGPREAAPGPAPAAAAAAEPAAEPEAPAEPSKGTASGEIAPVGEYVLGVLERMDLGPFEIEELEESDYTIYRLTGHAASTLLSGEGRTLNALQLLANQAASRVEDEPSRVVLDAEGDRANREEYLGRIAERAAQRARDSGRSVALEPMNGKDRRTAHMALREAGGIATMSIGEGRYRQVLVVPEGAPEYEEARQVAEAAASGERGE